MKIVIIFFTVAVATINVYGQEKQKEARFVLGANLASSNLENRTVARSERLGLSLAARLVHLWALKLGANRATYKDVSSNTRVDNELESWKLGMAYRVSSMVGLEAGTGVARFEDRRHNPNNCPDPRDPNSCFDPDPSRKNGPIYYSRIDLGLLRNLDVFASYSVMPDAGDFLYLSDDVNDWSFGVELKLPLGRAR